MNVPAAYRFTIIVPLYNERDNLPRLEEKLAGYLKKTTEQPACVLFVDDGSTDGGSPLLEAICRRHDDFFFLHFDQNRGLSAALKAGFEACRSPYAGYLDADLQTDPGDFELLLPYAADYELVTGVRTERKDGFGKRLISRLANALRRRIVHDTAVDTGCPLKVLQTAWARQLPPLDGMHRFLPALAAGTGARCKQVPVRHYPRTAGQSKFHLSNRFWKPIRDAFGYRWYLRRHIRYTVDRSKLD